jgi:hypothetical protein
VGGDLFKVVEPNPLIMADPKQKLAWVVDGHEALLEVSRLDHRQEFTQIP